jgi:dienelactone hydrolase
MLTKSVKELGARHAQHLLDSGRCVLKHAAMRIASFCLLLALAARAQDSLPGTGPLAAAEDRSAEMVAGIDRFLMRELQESVNKRSGFWKRDFSSPEAYDKSINANRERFRKIIGAIDPRVASPVLEFIHTSEHSAVVSEDKSFTIYEVRWPVLEGVYGEGLLLQPKSPPLGAIIALPDADQTPEGLADQFAARLAAANCIVLIPTLVNREDTHSGNPKIGRFTNQPHREWIYRQAYELGRHIIGYEVQKVLAAVDWLTKTNLKVAVAGYGEGALIAFYSAAIDPRIQAALVSGYFGPRQQLWDELIYRNVFGLLEQFGDAEIASMITPRKLLIEYSESPKIDGPPLPKQGRGGAAPGKWSTPSFATVETEYKRATKLVPNYAKQIEFLYGNEGVTVGPGSDYARSAVLAALGAKNASGNPASSSPARTIDAAARQQRQVKQLDDFTQARLRDAERARDEFFWKPLRDAKAENWDAACEKFTKIFWEDVIGRFTNANISPNVRTRKLYDKPKWTGYEVVLDVFPDVFAWGYLLVPKDINASEKRPVVVCQHGLEGVPEDVVSEDPKNKGFVYYQGYAARLADLGFVVYAPHNPYRGRDAFRVLQRKANPLGKSLFSVIIAQHQATLDWLSNLPFVDPARLGFYGLSYGGKTAMRVPAVLNRYALSICSADFNEWIVKNAVTDSGYSYMYTIEYEMPEFNLGNTFNYAEMAALIAPRPFMVERGHHDGVAPDEWVAYEYAKVRRLYARLGIPESSDIEFFNGPHSIHGKGTFEFLKKHLRWQRE